MDLPTRADLFNDGADEMVARGRTRPIGQRISSAAIYLEGSDVNILTAGASAMADECIRQLCRRIGALYLDSAGNDDDADLDRLVADRFSPDIVRKEAGPSMVTLSFSRVTGGFAGVTLGTDTRLRTAQGTEFQLAASVSIPLGSSGPVLGTARATQAGSTGNVAPGTITQFASAPADPDLLVTNPQAAAGGADKETNPSLRARARAFFAQARRGTVDAIQQGALAFGGVAQATVFELLDSDGLQSGVVEVAIADAAGQSNDALNLAVRNKLLAYRCAGIVPDVFGAVPVYEVIKYRLRFAAGVDTTVAMDQVSLGTISATNLLGPGQTLERATLFAVAKSVPGVIVLQDAVIAPAGDVVPQRTQVIRTQADLISNNP